MIIELYGLPGSGKSTLATELVEHHDFVKVRLPTKTSVTLWLILGWLSRPLFYARQLIWCIWHNPSFFFFWNFYCQRAAKHVKAHWTRKEKVIIDEGLLQNVLSYPEEPLETSSITRFFTQSIQKQKVVVVRVDETIRQERIKQRPTGWRQKQHSAEWAAVMTENFIRSTKYLSECHTITLNESQGASELVTKLQQDKP